MSALLFILKILGLILALLLLLLLLILLVPVGYEISAGADGGIGGNIRISWLVFSFCFDLNEPPSEKKKEKTLKGKTTKKKKPKKKTLKEEPEKNDKKSIFIKIKDMLSIAENIRDYPDRNKIISMTLKLLKRLFRALRPRQLRLKALVGCEDPSLTGYILGAAAIIRGLTPWDLQVSGDFGQKILNLNLYVKGRIVLGMLLWPLAIYAVCMRKHIIIFLRWRKEYGQ